MYDFMVDALTAAGMLVWLIAVCVHLVMSMAYADKVRATRGRVFSGANLFLLCIHIGIYVTTLSRLAEAGTC